MPAPSTRAPKPPETPLLALIRERVRDRGPLTVADYIALVLNHPEHGYYHSRNPFGAAGDFVTAPDISQMFGEMIGAWLVACWHQINPPTPLRLVELGPGRGQLLADVVRTVTRLTGIGSDLEVHLVESSRRLREVQRAKLPDLAITWHDALETVPDGPFALIANEFFDALPVHQLICRETGWAERLITSGDDGRLVFTDGKAPAALLDMIPNAAAALSGEIAEVSPIRRDLARHIGERIAHDGGIALIIDYGAAVDRPTGDTLQAVSQHDIVDPLERPGEADLTTHVEFKSLIHAVQASGARTFGPIPQGAFLRRLGMEQRALALSKHTDERQAADLRHALFRLTDANAMGELFKAIALTRPNFPAPPGFDLATIDGETQP